MHVQRGNTIGLALKEGIYSNCFKLPTISDFSYMIYNLFTILEILGHFNRSQYCYQFLM